MRNRRPSIIAIVVTFGLAGSIACGLSISGEAPPDVDAGPDGTASLPEPGDAHTSDVAPRPQDASIGDASIDADAAPTCDVAQLETCNGLDDDCNGIADDPCPSSIALGTPGGPFISFGGAGGTAFEDTCPDGEVLIGVTAQTDSWIRQLFARCGKITVSANKAATPFTYSLVIDPGTILPNHGTDPGTTQAATCPANSVVVGISGRAGGSVDAITLSCAPLSLSGVGTSFGLTLGTTTSGGTVGGAGGSLVATASCASGTVVTRMTGSATARIETVGFACSAPSVVRYGDP